MIAYSKLLSEKVGPSDDNYYKWAGFMLMPFVNGQYRQYMNNGFQYEMVKLAKKAAFPFAGYMTEGNGMEKLQNLFDIVSEGSLSAAMKEAMADSDNKNKGESAIRTAVFKKWWEGKGRKALDTLQSPRELFTLKKKLEAQRGDQDKLNQYNTLVDYIDHKYNDEDRDNINDTF